VKINEDGRKDKYMDMARQGDEEYMKKYPDKPFSSISFNSCYL
jgi:hypothetical protein